MGRHKIAIQKIQDARGRHVTFNKRKNGLLKKAMELSLLCDCQIALVILEKRNEKIKLNEKINLIQYATSDMDDILLRYSKKEPSVSLNNSDYERMYGGKIDACSSSSSSSSAASSASSASSSTSSTNPLMSFVSDTTSKPSKKRKASAKKEAAKKEVEEEEAIEDKQKPLKKRKIKKATPAPLKKSTRSSRTKTKKKK